MIGPSVPSDRELGALRDRFDGFALEARGQSPLYERLSRVAARDDVALAILAAAPEAPQRRPNLLFAAVHDLLLSGHDHRLADYYPSLGGAREPDRTTDEAFLDLLRSCRLEILQRVETRNTQTNEVGRSGALWPALRRLAEELAAPLTLVELGASAGLLLHLDRYRYRYDGVYPGASSSPVSIETVAVGASPPAGAAPHIAGRIGVDLSPLDPRDETDGRWLRACVWPEEVDRITRLRDAIDVARRHDDVHLVSGDLVTDLTDLLAAVDPATVPVVFHSAAFAYLSPEARATAVEAIEGVGAERPLAWLSLEAPFLEPFRTQHERLDPPPGEMPFLLGLTRFGAGGRREELLGRAHPHGQWLEWLAKGGGAGVR